jgi:RND superfamily putative drug exporter
MSVSTREVTLVVQIRNLQRSPAVTRTKLNPSLSARMGRWSATHWKTATFGWLAFVVASFAVGSVIGTKKIDPAASGSGESGHVMKTLAKEFKQPAQENVLVHSAHATTDDPEFRRAVGEVVATLSAQPAARNIQSPFAAGNQGQISKDGHAVLVGFKLRGTELAQSDKDVVPIEAAISKLEQSYPALSIGEFGDASIDEQLNKQVSKDFGKAGTFSLPITLLVLLLAFGALIAAGLPLLLGLTAVAATIGLVALPSHLIPMDQNVSVVVMLIGLAVGVDYSLFYLKREREERRAGRDNGAALEVAAATSGRAVLISGLTVIVAMAGLLFTGDPTFMSFGMAMIIVVGVAVIGSLTVLPALLSKLGDKVDKPRIPLVGRLRSRRPAGESRFWNAVLGPVLRHPVIATIASGGALVALAFPALHMHTVTPGPETFPKSIPVMKVYDQMQKSFPGGSIPAVVMVKTDATSGNTVRTAITNLRQEAVATGKFNEPTSVSVNAKGTVATVLLPIAGNGTDSASNVIPSTVGRLPNADIGVAGLTAGSYDFNVQMKHAAPFVFAFVLGLAFILLLMTFRSIVIAIKAIVLNLLSVAAAYGVLVLIFQHGIGKGLLGFSDAGGGVVAYLPIFLFVILFGLSMDYHVFILSRIREAHDRGMSTNDAVAYGIKSTASVVTSAALVMVGVFSIFGTLSFLFLKEFGVGLAAAVLIDATLVRAVLLPAAMKLLGEANWYLPRWLEWLPRLGAEESPAPVVPAASPSYEAAA